MAHSKQKRFSDWWNLRVGVVDDVISIHPIPTFFRTDKDGWYLCSDLCQSVINKNMYLEKNQPTKTNNKNQYTPFLKPFKEQWLYNVGVNKNMFVSSLSLSLLFLPSKFGLLSKHAYQNKSMCVRHVPHQENRPPPPLHMQTKHVHLLASRSVFNFFQNICIWQSVASVLLFTPFAFLLTHTHTPLTSTFMLLSTPTVKHQG